MDLLSQKLNQVFPGKVVRKDLTKKIKEGANVPVYVLEYLLGMYCATDDEDAIKDGVETVKRILADNFVRPDEAEKVKSKIKEQGIYTIIDKVTVRLNEKIDTYEAELSNLGLKDVMIDENDVKKYDRLLIGGIWCILKIKYSYEDNKRMPFAIETLTPIQLPNMDLNDIYLGRKQFTTEEWIDIIIRSMGIEPTKLTHTQKFHYIERAVPLVENNYNLCELGPRGTGKSHIYKEISPNSILVSGGQTTVANLFYNMSTQQVGLVGMWDCVAFDEVAGITFKDKDGIQIMKDYMASGSFARGKEEKAASASMVFVGNINHDVSVMLKTSHLFEPFPEAMAYDTAFLDRIHAYIPGWEIPKYRPDHFTDDYGFITDYLSEFMREMRKESYGDSIDRFFHLGKNLNQRDTIAVRRLVDGFVKLLYPDGEFCKEDIAEILDISLELRRRVKEQLKKIGGMEFYDVNFSYIDNQTFDEHYVGVPETGGGKIIPDKGCNPGHVYTISRGKNGIIGVFRLESQMLPGNGKFIKKGFSLDKDSKSAADTAFSYLKAHGNSISHAISTTTKDYIIDYQDLQGIGMTKDVALPTLVAISSIALTKSTIAGLAIIGDISISGTVNKVEDLAAVLQVCVDSGAKKVLIPISSASDFGTVPADLLSAIQPIFYSTPQEAVFRALGVE